MESDTRWVPDDFAEDEFRKLAQLVVDFARNVGLAEAQDDDLLMLVIAAYRAGRESTKPKLALKGWVS
jgi:hypothetical protein